MNAGRKSDSVITRDAYAVHGSNAASAPTARAGPRQATRRVRRYAGTAVLATTIASMALIASNARAPSDASA